MIFDDAEMAKNIDFSRFCRTRYRTQNGGRGVNGTDVPFLASGLRFENVNYAPYDIKYTIIVQYYCMFYFSTLKR